MTQLEQKTAFGLLSLLLVAQAAEVSGKPSIRASAHHASDNQVAAITVEASDSEGLDSLEITCPEADSSYHTQLSRLAVDRHFKRSFGLPELFPAAGDWKKPVRVVITVRNTRGATRSTTILVRPNHPKKGK